jgi:glycosyltransferase involved in cell wall biosynthesis
VTLVSNADVTVVVVCFNYGRYLGEAVGSALGQTGGRPHVIVVDDGSTDEATLAALDALPPEVDLVRQANSGVCAARNSGFARVETPYVIFLDADDRLAPRALETLRSAFDGDPPADLGFSYGHQRFFGAWDGVMRFPPYDPYRLLDRHLIGPTALMRRELLRDVGGYDAAFLQFEDWELWLSALAHGWRGVRIDAVTHEYRQHGQSKNRHDRRRYRAMRRQLKRKHAALYARRRELARESDLGWASRLVSRAFWGPRPLPAFVESFAKERLWGASSPAAP